jgi:hypothetical protein
MPLLTTLCQHLPSPPTLPTVGSVGGATVTVLALPIYLLLLGALLAGVVPEGTLETATGLLALAAGLRLAMGTVDLFSRG